MSRVVRAPDGSVQVFPDDATDKEISDALSAQPSHAARTWTDTARDVGIGIAKGVGATAANIGGMMVGAGMFPGSTPALPSPTIQAAQQAMTATNTPQRVGKGLETAAELAPGAIAAGSALARGASSLAPAVASKLGVTADIAPDVVGVLSPRAANAMRVGQRALNVLQKLGGTAEDASVNETVSGALDALKVPARMSSTGTMPSMTSAVPSPSGLASVEAAAPSSAATAPPRPYFLKPEAQMAPAAAPPQTPAALPQAWQQFAKPASFPDKEIEGSGLAAAFDQELAKRGMAASDVIPQVMRNKALPSDVRQQLVSALEKVARKQAGVSVPSMTDPTLPAAWQAFIQK